jgi:hypothetical protein
MKSNLKQRVGAAVAAVALIGVVISPAIASAASQSANTTINADVAAVISISTGNNVNISLTPTSGGVVSSASDTVTVSTNNTAGYTLNIADSDATTTLTSGSNTFSAISGTKTAPIALTNGTWGFAVATGTTGIGTNGFDSSYSAETNAGSSTTKWAGVPASGSPMLLKSTTGTATNDTTTVWYAAKASTSQANGTYTDTVTYTATTK